MKKSLLAAAVLASFAASAFAAPSVTLYGLIDTGISSFREHDSMTVGDLDNPPTAAFSYHRTRMTSGVADPSRWGLKGTEISAA